MQYSVLDLFGAALVPELGSDISAGAAGNGHLALIGIAAVRADPDQFAVRIFLDGDLAVITAGLAVIALGVELGVHDIVVDKLHDGKHRRDIALHIRHLHVADGAARGKSLELRLKGQLGKSVDLLRHMDMVAVRDIILVGHTRDDPETALQALREAVGGRFHRRPVQGVADVLGGAPLGALVVEVLHHAEREGLRLRIRMGLAHHPHAHLVETGVAEGNGRVVVKQQLIDLLALFQSGQRTVLPQDRRNIGDGAEKALMPAPQRTVAELQSLVQAPG